MPVGDADALARDRARRVRGGAREGRLGAGLPRRRDLARGLDGPTTASDVARRLGDRGAVRRVRDRPAHARGRGRRWASRAIRTCHGRAGACGVRTARPRRGTRRAASTSVIRRRRPRPVDGLSPFGHGAWHRTWPERPRPPGLGARPVRQLRRARPATRRLHADVRHRTRPRSCGRVVTASVTGAWHRDMARRATSAPDLVARPRRTRHTAASTASS